MPQDGVALVQEDRLVLTRNVAERHHDHRVLAIARTGQRPRPTQAPRLARAAPRAARESLQEEVLDGLGQLAALDAIAL
jgi:hypothetical protein